MHSHKQKSGLVTGALLPVGLVCVFALCALLMAVLGVRAYQTLQEDVDDEYNSTVVANYLRTKLSQHNRAGAVEIRQENGVEVLIIKDDSGDRRYETRIFVHAGSLREIYISEEQPFTQTGGVAIAQVTSCRFTLTGNLFRAEIVSPQGVTSYTSFVLVQGGAA